jgi:hypothetical protein
MSLFRSEARKDRNTRLSTADMAGLGDEAMERPVADARPDANAPAQVDRAARHASIDERAARSDGMREVEDAVIKHEQRAEPRTDGDARRMAEGHGPRVGDGHAPRADSPRMDGPRMDGPHEDGNSERLAPLFSPAVAQEFRGRWDATQIGFVDNPRQAVQQADELVAQVMKSLAQSFAQERHQLEAQMNETASTENLRVALQRYRSFFQRLLTL